MTRRLLALGLATVVLVVGGMNAQAGTLTPPTTLDQLVTPSATPDNGIYVSNGNDLRDGNLDLASFGYTNHLDPPAPSKVAVLDAPALPTGFQGIEFQGGFGVGLNSPQVDYTFTYTVMATTGSINGAFLRATGNDPTGNGFWSVSENIVTGAGTIKLSVDNNTPDRQASVSFPDVPAGTPITITKDIFLKGDTSGATVSVIDQAFSTGAIPEPTSMALMGIGLTGLFTFRRFFKRAFVG